MGAREGRAQRATYLAARLRRTMCAAKPMIPEPTSNSVDGSGTVPSNEKAALNARMSVAFMFHRRFVATAMACIARSRDSSCTLSRGQHPADRSRAVDTYEVYVIQGQTERDWSDCQTALAHVPARMTALPYIGDPDALIARTRDADALVVAFSPITRAVMSALEGLKTVVRTGVGYDVIDVAAATELGVIVVNIPDLWIREVANHALGLLLAWNRKIIALDRQVHGGTWGVGAMGPRTGSIHGETVGIVGLGNIGSAFARRIAAFETDVIACDPYVDDRRFKELGVERVSLESLAERADYVSVHTLLNAETRHLIGEAFFRRMKPTAILINTSRGPVVDEKALARALQDKRLAGAALDVWEQEPLAADNPLLHMDNVIATPHAAYFSTAAVAAVPRRCGEEVSRVLTGQRPLNVVNPEIYAPGAARRARP